MRPAIDEQLRETRRILGDLAPQLDGYSAQILAMALANLELVETAWGRVLPYLLHDNDAALALLVTLRDEVGTDLAAAIDDAGRASACDPFDASALQRRNEDLQALVERAIGACAPAGRRRIHAALLDRTARHPMRAPRARPDDRTETGG